MKINPVRAYSIEKILFFLFGIISVLHFFFLKFVPSLDGPQHLYTSSVIVELVKSNDTIKEFFTFNDLIVGNWVGHFLLSLFNFFLPAQFAEKILLVVYVFGIAYAFRYLIKSISGYVPYHAVIIYPFAFTTLLLHGYYNYSLAFIALFITLGFWVRIKDHLNLKNGIIFLLLQLLLFLSHIFVFVLYGYILIFYLVFNFLFEFNTKTSKKEIIKRYFKKVFYIFLTSSVSIILCFKYYIAANALSSGYTAESYSFHELVSFFFRIRSLIGFHYEKESVVNIILMIILLILVVFSFLKNRQRTSASNNTVKKKYQLIMVKNDIWLLLFLMVLILYFVFPDTLTSGNIVNRISILMFFLLITWITLQAFPKKLSIVLALCFMLLSFAQRIVQLKFQRDLDNKIAIIRSVNQFIEPNTLLLPVSRTENWPEIHFHCYLGIDKPVVNLRNPQCFGQFPVIWKKDKIPWTLLGDDYYSWKKFKWWASGNSENPPRFIDYILIWRTSLFGSEEEDQRIKKLIDIFYTMVYKSPYGNAELYKFRSEDVARLIEKIDNDTIWKKHIIDKARRRKMPYENILYIDAAYTYRTYQHPSNEVN